MSYKTIPMRIDNDTVIYFETKVQLEEDIEDVAFNNRIFSLEKTLKEIEALSKSFGKVLSNISPTKASIEFGVEIGVKAGEAVAFIVSGESKANIKINLEWEKRKD